MLVFVPLIAGFVCLFLPRRISFVSKAATLVISIAALTLSIYIFRGQVNDFRWPLLQIGDFNLELLLSARPLGTFILMFAMGFGFLITLYSLKSVSEAKGINIYFGSLLLTIGGSAGILLSGHLLFLLIFWEIVTASLYLLITTGGKNSNFAATKSFAMIGASDAAFLLGIGLVWVASGTFEISKITLSTTSAVSISAFLLLMVAAITKAGAMPLHTWLPTTGEYAPASVMALLPAAIDKLLGIFLLVIVIRELFVLDWDGLNLILAIIGSVTIITAAMVAIVQHNMKKLLAYSAISQVGYMILGIATGTTLGLIAAVFHMLNNSIYKCCLFLGGGAVEQATGTDELDSLGGLGKKMPITFATFMIAALSVSGIPPLNGFVSKWLIYQSVIQMGSTQTNTAASLWSVWLLIAVFGSAITLAYSIKIIHSVFLSRLPTYLKERGIAEVSILQTLPMIVLAFLCVLFGVFYYNIPLKQFIFPALNIDIQAVVLGTWQSGLATILIMAGIILGLVILIIGFAARKVRIVPTWTCGEIQENDQMIIPGSHFYKTVSSMGGLKQLYSGQEKGYFDPYNQSGNLGMLLTRFLRWLHSGVLPMYLTWMTLGLLVILFIVCRIW